MDLADNTQEMSFFADGDALAQQSSTFEPYSPDEARRRRTWIAIALTGVILLIVVAVCVAALPAAQA